MTTRVQSQIEQLADGLFVANAAAQLAGNVDRLDNGLHAGQIHGPPFAGPVQIDQVQVFGPLLDELPSHGGGVVAIDGFAVVIPLPQADAFSAA